MPRVARIDELPELPDGIYSIQVNGADQVRFQIHTVSTGQLAGQRIVKKQNGTAWKGFAFVKVDADDPESITYNGIQVWRSMQTAVTESYARSVSLAIRRFVGRVNNEPEDISTFIMIEDCPEIPERIRAQIDARRRIRQECEAEQARRTRYEEAFSLPRVRGNIAGNINPTINVGTVGNTVRWHEEDVPLRTSPLAMSCFNPEEVR